MGSSSPSAELIACAPRHHHQAAAAADRRLRPQHDQPLKCPRCESTHTKFCYYNNYSPPQPRYFCKTCRRYWTKGGSLRNVPVGGGCRKNKRASSASKKQQHAAAPPPMHAAARQMMAAAETTGLHLSFSCMQQLLPGPNTAAAVDPALCSLGGLLDWKYDPILAGPGGLLEGASSEAAHFAGGPGMMGMAGAGGGGGGECHALNALRYAAAGLGEAFGSSRDDGGVEVKPLSLEWYGEAASRAAGQESAAISSLSALGLWSGMIGGAHHGSSAAI
ncbi:hypothetical protein PR202_gb09516 [Eleusine coracana subsp. coracana]|uniref:Dof zinc finger protein n=1 Tax=Eleusine coracana subsp. coracana TaxID=191504 RepID=A0AAV5EIH1_ELECO|nr:hypothetical protein PR202_gb09516 [Eleusine coracana subsp. coracana]